MPGCKGKKIIKKPTDPFTKLSNEMMTEAIGIVFADEIAERMAEKGLSTPKRETYNRY